jgi:hypothetical protein
MDLRRDISEYLHRGNELCHRLRSSEAETLTAVDVHALKAQLYLLNYELDNLRKLQQTTSKKADSATSG